MRPVDRWMRIHDEIFALASEDTSSPPDEQTAIFDIIKHIDLRIRHVAGIGYGAVEISAEIDAIYEFSDRPNVIFDVGANAGFWSLMALQKWPTARVYSYEPQSVFRDQIQNNVNQSSGRLFFKNAAVSERQGTAVIHRDSPGSGLASLHKRDLSRHGFEFDDKETVNTVTLKQEMIRHGIETIDILKIDVEGHELGVVKGLGDYLSKVRLIQFEFGGTMIDSRTFLRDFYGLLEPAGFTEFYRIAPTGIVNVGPYSEYLEQFDIQNFIAINRG